MPRNQYKTYNINGKNVHCPTLPKQNDHSSDRIMSKGEELCDLISKSSSGSYYNYARLYKLNNEYKCSSNYKWAKSSHDPKPMPNCQDQIYDTLTYKLKSVSDGVIKLKVDFDQKQIDTQVIKNDAQNAIDFIENLQYFTKENLHKVNSAFEVAKYDTNASGYGTLFASIFMFPIGLGIHVMNAAFYNNEFDGKIERAHSDAAQVLDDIKKVEVIVSYYDHDIYV